MDDVTASHGARYHMEMGSGQWWNYCRQRGVVTRSSLSVLRTPKYENVPGGKTTPTRPVLDWMGGYEVNVVQQSSFWLMVPTWHVLCT